MPICPSCYTNQTKRKNGECPNCGEEIIIYDGYWYSASVGSPTQAIVTLFEQLVSKKLSTPTRNVRWSIPKGTEKHKRELGYARTILEKSKGSLDWANGVLQRAFYNEKFSWKNRQSLLSVLGDFDLLDAIMEAESLELEERDRKAEDAYNSVMNREDLFSNG